MTSILQFDASQDEVRRWLDKRYQVQWHSPLDPTLPVLEVTDAEFQIRAKWGWLKLSHQGGITSAGASTRLVLRSSLTRQSIFIICLLLAASSLLAVGLAMALHRSAGFDALPRYGLLPTFLIPTYLVWLYGWVRTKGEMRRFQSEMRRGMHLHIAMMRRPNYR